MWGKGGPLRGLLGCVGGTGEAVPGLSCQEVRRNRAPAGHWPGDVEGRCGQDDPREPAPHLAVVLLGQARTTTLIVPPNSGPADPGGKKARGPFGPGLRRKNAALSLQLRVPESWNQQLRSWQPPRRLGQPPPWSHGPRHSVLCDSSLAGWTEDLHRQRCFRCPLSALSSVPPACPAHLVPGPLHRTTRYLTVMHNRDSSQAAARDSI